MKFWVLGLALVLAPLQSPASAQDECPSGRPFRLIPTIAPVVGQSPMWVTTGSGPIVWEGSNHPAPVVWIRDRAVKGPAFLSGKDRAGTGKARFATTLYGLPEERFKLDLLGVKPTAVKEVDLQRYTFHRTYVWFPAAACYEITARVGQQQSMIYLSVGPREEPRKAKR